MNEVGSCLQGSTTGELRVLQVVDGLEVAIDERGVRELPQVLGRLEFGREGGEEEQVDVVGHPEAHA